MRGRNSLFKAEPCLRLVHIRQKVFLGGCGARGLLLITTFSSPVPRTAQPAEAEIHSQMILCRVKLLVNQSLYRALDESSDRSGVLELFECQVELLPDVSFDVVRASALAGDACVEAQRNLMLKDWRMDAVQKSSVHRMPFQGSVLFGAELESKLNKLLKEKKHSSSIKSVSGDRSFFKPKPPPLRQAMRKLVVRD
ncbi:hypothetical protein NDU88_003240 [Pleurodeles waltl]|uniref:Lamina-associated polypeptide 2 alpha C-terminal domain-containing protein n=1 Tax=Pleurodeles waltl TaxID=8319 RepID=A0AAV7SFD8_PLEWA|nr:hypothetical protein NDU88_003240 [Pleurodeles waltl]